MNIQCPHRQNEEDQVKAGKTRTGSQRYKCKSCNRVYTPEPKQQGYPEEIHQGAVRLSIDGQNFRRIARQLGVDHKSVINWVNAHAAQQKQAPVNNTETDEVFTFVGSKQQSLRDAPR